MASLFDQAAVRRQLTEHPEHAVYAAWTVFDLTADLLLHVFKARLRALGQRCFDFQDRTLGIPRHLGFLPALPPRLAVEMCFYLRLLWMWVTALATLWLVPQDRRHGEILWLWSIPLLGVFVLWGKIRVVRCRPFPYVITTCTDTG